MWCGVFSHHCILSGNKGRLEAEAEIRLAPLVGTMRSAFNEEDSPLWLPHFHISCLKWTRSQHSVLSLQNRCPPSPESNLVPVPVHNRAHRPLPFLSHPNAPAEYHLGLAYGALLRGFLASRLSYFSMLLTYCHEIDLSSLFQKSSVVLYEVQYKNSKFPFWCLKPYAIRLPLNKYSHHIQ